MLNDQYFIDDLKNRADLVWEINLKSKSVIQ